MRRTDHHDDCVCAECLTPPTPQEQKEMAAHAPPTEGSGAVEHKVEFGIPEPVFGPSVNCPNCSAVNSPNNTVCHQCGESMASQPVAESETPRTDAEAEYVNPDDESQPSWEAVEADFARTLERELNAAKCAIQLQETGKYGRIELQQQLDAAKAEVERLSRIASKLEIELAKCDPDLCFDTMRNLRKLI